MLTNRGKSLIGLTGFLIIVAWITEISLVYFLISITFSLISICFFISKFSLGKIEFVRDMKDEAFEDDVLNVKLTVKNNGFLPIRWFQFIDCFSAGPPENTENIALIITLRKKETLSWIYQGECFKRGLYSIGPIRIIGGDPMGFFSFKREFKTFSRLIVYPKLFEIKHFPFMVKGAAPWFGIDTARLSGEDQEFYGIREYKRGDITTRIHWRSTARLGELIVKQLEKNAVYKSTIVVDLNKYHNIGWGKETTLEYGVKIAASTARYLIRRGGLVQLVVYGEKPIILPFSKGESHLFRIMELLATVDSNGISTMSNVLNEISPFISANSTLIPIILDIDIDAVASLIPYKIRGVNLIPFVLVTSTFDARWDGIDIKSIKDNTQKPIKLGGLGIKSYHICQGENLEKKFSRIAYEPVFYF